MSEAIPRTRRWYWLNTALAIVILVPALIGFGSKFREFILLYGGYEHTKEQQRLLLNHAKQEDVAAQQDRQGLGDEATEGAFALMPILNYLLVSFGFLILFVAAICHGMFRNIEQPKYEMLERDAAIDLVTAEHAHATERAEAEVHA